MPKLDFITPQLKRPYILLIDDDEDDLEMFASEFRKQGIMVKVFASSTNALGYLKVMSEVMELPCLIILDFNMPGKRGIQLLLLIRDIKNTENIPIVFCSTGMSNFLKNQLLANGALDGFTKPWNYTELIEQVNRFEHLAKRNCSACLIASKCMGWSPVLSS